MAPGDPASAGSTATVWADGGVAWMRLVAAALAGAAPAVAGTGMGLDGAVAWMRLVAAAEAGAGPADAGIGETMAMHAAGRLTGLCVNPERQAGTEGFESPMMRRSGVRPQATGATHARSHR